MFVCSCSGFGPCFGCDAGSAGSAGGGTGGSSDAYAFRGRNDACACAALPAARLGSLVFSGVVGISIVIISALESAIVVAYTSSSSSQRYPSPSPSNCNINWSLFTMDARDTAIAKAAKSGKETVKFSFDCRVDCADVMDEVG